MRPPQMDPDEARALLGVPVGAPMHEAKQAWLALVRRWHPDGVPAADRARAEEETKRLNLAWEVVQRYGTGIPTVAPVGADGRYRQHRQSTTWADAPPPPRRPAGAYRYHVTRHNRANRLDLDDPRQMFEQVVNGAWAFAIGVVAFLAGMVLSEGGTWGWHYPVLGAALAIIGFCWTLLFLALYLRAARP